MALSDLWFEGAHHTEINAHLRAAWEAFELLYHRADTNGDVVRRGEEAINAIREAVRLAQLQSAEQR